MIKYLEEVTRSLVLILPKVSQYFKTFQDKGGDNNNINKLMSLRVHDRPSWLNGWVFVYELSACGFESVAVT